MLLSKTHFQGIFMFIFYVVLSDNLKEEWMKVLGRCRGDTPSYARPTVPINTRCRGECDLYLSNCHYFLPDVARPFSEIGV